MQFRTRRSPAASKGRGSPAAGRTSARNQRPTRRCRKDAHRIPYAPAAYLTRLRHHRIVDDQDAQRCGGHRRVVEPSAFHGTLYLTWTGTSGGAHRSRVAHRGGFQPLDVPAIDSTLCQSTVFFVATDAEGSDVCPSSEVAAARAFIGQHRSRRDVGDPVWTRSLKQTPANAS